MRVRESRLPVATGPVGVVCFLGILVAGQAWPAGFRSPSGYTLGLPDGWEVYTGKTLARATGQTEMMPALTSAFSSGTIDLALIAAGGDAVPSHAFVGVAPAIPPVNKAGLTAAQKRMIQELERAGIRALLTVKSKIETLGGRQCMALQCSFAMDGPATIEQLVILIPAGRASCRLVLRAEQSRFLNCAPDFRNMAASVQIYSPMRMYWYSFSPVARLGMTVLFVVVGLYVLAKVWKRAR